MRKYIPYICVLVIIIVCVLVIVFTKDKEYQVFCFKSNYNVSSHIDDKDYINIKLGVNQDDGYLTDKNQFVDSSITNKDSDLKVTILIDEILNTKEIIDYQNEKYTIYNFKFKLQIGTNSYFELFIKNAILNLSFKNYEQYFFEIGDVSYVKVDKKTNDFIAFSKIKPLTETVNNNCYLSGLIMGIRNISGFDFIIKEISLKNEGMYIGDGAVILDENISYDSFSNLFQFNFSSVTKGNNYLDISVGYNENINIAYPIYYDKLKIANSFVIEFVIEVNGRTYSEYLYDYVFYEPLSELINKNNIKVYVIND